MRTWRNWQTRKIQVLMVARLCRFKSCCPHQSKQKRTETIRFVFSYLWFATGLVTMQCIVCTLRVSLHAVQLTQRLASKLARLCYYVRFALYKSCCPHQKKQSERVVFFHAAADLKQNYVLSANKRSAVCPCTQQTWLTKEGID